MALIFLLCACTTASDYVKKANLAIEKKQYQEAIGLLDKALAKDPKCKEAYTEKAHCYTELKLDDSAIVSYSRLITFDPNNTLALYNLGLCKYRQSKFDEAIDFFKRGFLSKGYNPDDTSAFQYTFELNDFGAKMAGNDTRFDVPFADLFYMTGLAYHSAGHKNIACGYFMNCISRNAYLGESYYMVGYCWLEMNRKDKACEAFRNASFFGYSLAREEITKYCQ